jgi:chlorite dismutase
MMYNVYTAMDTNQQNVDSMMSFWSATGTERASTGGENAEAKLLRKKLEMHIILHKRDQMEIKALQEKIKKLSRKSSASSLFASIEDAEDDVDDA